MHHFGYYARRYTCTTSKMSGNWAEWKRFDIGCISVLAPRKCFVSILVSQYFMTTLRCVGAFSLHNALPPWSLFAPLCSTLTHQIKMICVTDRYWGHDDMMMSDFWKCAINDIAAPMLASGMAQCRGNQCHAMGTGQHACAEAQMGKTEASS